MIIRLFACLFLLGTGLCGADVAARNVVTSEQPQSVSVTVYRDPERGFDDPINRGDVYGYALITEQRVMELPVGEVELRFEGVAGGIVPQSAIVTGLPGGILEKNHDAALLSPGALLNGHLGKYVSLRRTSGANGKTITQRAKIRTGAGGGMVVETAEGLEALQCTGLNETLIYEALPEGLSDKPTLSVRSRLSRPITATVTLSYLAYGFDWQTNYVANISEDGKNMNLFAWITLINDDETSFVDAQTQAVAGEVNRTNADEAGDILDNISAPQIALRCWPAKTTSDIPFQTGRRASRLNRFATAFEADEEVIVTAQRRQKSLQAIPLAITVASTAELENLGDLKLYRIPVPVTVAANAQKQVAMFQKKNVKYEKLYKARPNLWEPVEGRSLRKLFRFRNEEKDGLGIPLPSGNMIFFQKYQDNRILLGQGYTDDKAIAEKVDVGTSDSGLLYYSVRLLNETEVEAAESDANIAYNYELMVHNAANRSARVEIEFLTTGTTRLKKTSKRLRTIDQEKLWRIKVPANSERKITYTLVRQR